MPVVSFLLFVFVTSFTPGPNTIMSMAFANKYGLNRTVKFCLGVAVGFFIISLMCSFFNLFLANLIPVIELPLTIFGVAYMLYLAYRILTSKNSDVQNQESNRNFFLIGMLLQFVNPKAILFGLTVAATFIIPYYNSYTSYILFSLFLAAVGLVSTLSWGFFGSVLQKFLQQYRQQFNIVMALLLVYVAVSILLK